MAKKPTSKQLAQAAAVAVTELIQPVLSAYQKKGLRIPTDDQCRQWIAGSINARAGQWRKTEPKGPAAGFWLALQFRTGRRTTIYGLIKANMQYGLSREDVDAADTLAIIVSRYSKQISAAARAAYQNK